MKAENAQAGTPERVIGLLTAIVQIAAVVIGGLWTYAKFFATEAPLFSSRGETSSEFHGPSFAAYDACDAHLRVTFKNTGKSPVNIRKVVVGKVSFNFANVVDEEYVDVNLMEAELQEHGDKISYSDDADGGPLVRLYRPGEASTHLFSWRLQPDERQDSWMYFKVGLYERLQDARPRWFEQGWAPACHQ